MNQAKRVSRSSDEIRSRYVHRATGARQGETPKAAVAAGHQSPRVSPPVEAPSLPGNTPAPEPAAVPVSVPAAAEAAAAAEAEAAEAEGLKEFTGRLERGGVWGRAAAAPAGLFAAPVPVPVPVPAPAPVPAAAQVGLAAAAFSMDS